MSLMHRIVMSEGIASETDRHFGTGLGARLSQGHSFAREDLLSATDVAQWLGVSRAWVYEHSNGRRRPYLPSVKLGKSVRFRPADVEAFILECERFNPIRAA
jgi:predicted DNA-binding transcriptional regulator AlpA